MQKLLSRRNRAGLFHRHALSHTRATAPAHTHTRTQTRAPSASTISIASLPSSAYLHFPFICSAFICAVLFLFLTGCSTAPHWDEQEQRARTAQTAEPDSAAIAQDPLPATSSIPTLPPDTAPDPSSAQTNPSLPDSPPAPTLAPSPAHTSSPIPTAQEEPEEGCFRSGGFWGEADCANTCYAMRKKIAGETIGCVDVNRGPSCTCGYAQCWNGKRCEPICTRGYTYTRVPYPGIEEYYCKIDQPWDFFNPCTSDATCADGFTCIAQTTNKNDHRCIPLPSYKLNCYCLPSGKCTC